LKSRAGRQPTKAYSGSCGDVACAQLSPCVVPPAAGIGNFAVKRKAPIALLAVKVSGELRS